MGSPPKYSAPDEDPSDQRDPLLGTPAQPEYQYPPAHGVDNQDSEAPAVIYYYNPRYPAKGDNERVMGILSRSREDTITTLQSAISSLSDVDRNRIHFHTLVNPDAPSVEQNWARVLDDVWVKMVQNKPNTLWITLEDRPEDTKLRKRRNMKIALGIVALGLVLIGAIVILFVSTTPKQAQVSTKA